MSLLTAVRTDAFDLESIRDLWSTDSVHFLTPDPAAVTLAQNELVGHGYVLKGCDALDGVHYDMYFESADGDRKVVLRYIPNYAHPSPFIPRFALMYFGDDGALMHFDRIASVNLTLDELKRHWLEREFKRLFTSSRFIWIPVFPGSPFINNVY